MERELHLTVLAELDKDNVDPTTEAALWVIQRHIGLFDVADRFFDVRLETTPQASRCGFHTYFEPLKGQTATVRSHRKNGSPVWLEFVAEPKEFETPARDEETGKPIVAYKEGYIVNVYEVKSGEPPHMKMIRVGLAEYQIEGTETADFKLLSSRRF